MFGKSSDSQTVDDSDGLKEVYDIFRESMKDDSSLTPEKIQQRRSVLHDEIEKKTDLSQFPKEMSCTTAFDELTQCFSFGGQLRNYYRFGEITMCERQYEKFKFCLGLKVKSEEEKNLKVQEFYKQRLLKDKLKGNSEDVWDARKEPLNNPFKEY